jgi:hypothetical protein
MIERVERFVTLGQEFKTVEKAIEYREGLIEKFLRQLPGFDSIRAKDRIAFVQSIIDGRKEFRKLLDYEYPAQ